MPSRTAWAAVSACRSSSIASAPLPSSANTCFIITITGPQPMRAAAGKYPAPDRQVPVRPRIAFCIIRREVTVWRD